MSVYLVAAYAVFWALTSIFILSLWARQRRIERDIEALKQHLERGSPKNA
ncbi:MAG: hypothetical protein KGY78_06140 [Anaerolineae bacterium]|nr:hypothetical protein [Anaerolineae bacterium]